MKIDQEIKKYFEYKIRAQKVPGDASWIYKTTPGIQSYSQKTSPLAGVLFHAVFLLFLGMVLAINSGTKRSLQQLDPENKIYPRVENTIRKSLADIKVYVIQGRAHSPQGGKK